MHRNSDLEWEDMGVALDLMLSAARSESVRPAPRRLPAAAPEPLAPRSRPLSPRALRLIETLPRSFRLHETRLNFPHVLEQLADHWHDPRQFAVAIDELTLIDRPNRQGFPFPILTELCNLRDFYFAEIHPEFRDRLRRGPI